MGDGGDDLLNGGADGDYLDGGPGANTIEAGAGDNCFNPAVGGCGTSATVKPRETSKVSVGETSAGTGLVQVYVVGSAGADGSPPRSAAPPSPSRSPAGPSTPTSAAAPL